MVDQRRLLSPTGTTLLQLEKNIYQHLKFMRQDLEGQKILVAVSGGVDSMVLLHVLNSIKSRLGFEIYCGHVNHGVRATASDKDAIFVSEVCAALGIELVVTKLTGLNPTAGENILRERRYEALSQMAKKIRARYVVTAHHHDDLLETRLMRLLQGTGLRGLQGMTLINAHGVLRPFLKVTRAAIEAYAQQKKLDWRHDSTNDDSKKLRNWIRHRWLGLLRRDHEPYVASLHQSLENLISEGGSTLASTPVFQGGVFDRLPLITNGAQGISDAVVYSYLRQYAKKRVTQRLVKEFKKQLLSRRKKFAFRVAGTDWQVDQNLVSPLDQGLDARVKESCVITP